jgi:hypothetical protein
VAIRGGIQFLLESDGLAQHFLVVASMLKEATHLGADPILRQVFGLVKPFLNVTENRGNVTASAK